jgi:hypothetical protein
MSIFNFPNKKHIFYLESQTRPEEFTRKVIKSAKPQASPLEKVKKPKKQAKNK